MKSCRFLTAMCYWGTILSAGMYTQTSGCKQGCDVTCFVVSLLRGSSVETGRACRWYPIIALFSGEDGRGSPFCIVQRIHEQRWHPYRWQSLLGGVPYDWQLAHPGGKALADTVDGRRPRLEHRDRPSHSWVWTDSVRGNSPPATAGTTPWILIYSNMSGVFICPEQMFILVSSLEHIAACC